VKSSFVVSTANRDPVSLQEELGPYKYLHTILEETPNGVVVVGPDHQVIHANPAASSFLSVEYGTLTNQPLERFIGEEYGDFYLLIQDYAKLQGKKDGLKIRHELEFNSGDEHLILNAVAVFPRSCLDYYLLYLIDITQQKQLEGELRRRNSFFQNQIDSSVDGIIASDRQGRIMLFNKEALSLLGYVEEDTQDLHVTKLYNEGVAYELKKRMRSKHFGGKGKLLRHEMIVKHKDGKDIPVSFSGGIIYDQEQEIGTFGLFTDLRAIQQVEEDLQQAQRMLMQSEKMAGLGRLAAGVAHEINNPMSGIMLYANLIQEDLGKDHKLSSDLDTIIHEVERCKVIVADLLEFSHQTTYEMEPTDLNDVIHKTITILQHQPLFQDIEFVLDLADNLNPIYGNSIRLNQVVMNIIVNAAQAMDGKGNLIITSSIRANNDLAEITIKDSGHGIPPELVGKIFDPFFSTKATGEGAGLGLSVSYAIVKEHKGSIRVASQPESGTTFTLRFPVVMETLMGENHG
jgi:two-component system, NtrC family, sensor kinase